MARNNTGTSKSATQSINNLLSALAKDYKHIRFTKGDHFYWSPSNKQIFYSTEKNDPLSGVTLLHELAHALLDHKTFNTDYDLLLMEVEAWEKAMELGDKYSVQITYDHIQDCLDTYRDWLYLRSICPKCGNNSLQKNSKTYECFNCSTNWKVSSSRLCRPYRKLATRS